MSQANKHILDYIGDDGEFVVPVDDYLTNRTQIRVPTPYVRNHPSDYEADDMGDDQPIFSQEQSPRKQIITIASAWGLCTIILTALFPGTFMLILWAILFALYFVAFSVDSTGDY